MDVKTDLTVREIVGEDLYEALRIGNSTIKSTEAELVQCDCEEGAGDIEGLCIAALRHTTNPNATPRELEVSAEVIHWYHEIQNT